MIRIMMDSETFSQAARFELPIGFRMTLRTAMGERSALVPEPSSLSANRLTTPEWSDWKEALKEQLSSTGYLTREVDADLDP